MVGMFHRWLGWQLSASDQLCWSGVPNLAWSMFINKCLYERVRSRRALVTKGFTKSGLLEFPENYQADMQA